MARKGALQLQMTESRKALFISALRESGGVFASACRLTSPHSTATCRTAPCYSSWRGLLARDATFAAQVEEVLEQARDDCETEILRRSTHGWEEPVYQKGQRVMDTDANGAPIKASIRKFSDVLLLARARALLPEKYGNNHQHHVVHSGSVAHGSGLSMMDLQSLSSAEIDQIESAFRLLQRARGDQKSIEHRPAEILNAEFETVDDGENTLAALEEIEQREAR